LQLSYLHLSSATCCHDLLSGTLHLTSELVEQWSAAAKGKASMGAMRQLLKAYRVACHYSDTEAETEASLQITSSRVFNQILLFVLKEVSACVSLAGSPSFNN